MFVHVQHTLQETLFLQAVFWAIQYSRCFIPGSGDKHKRHDQSPQASLEKVSVVGIKQQQQQNHKYKLFAV